MTAAVGDDCPDHRACESYLPRSQIVSDNQVQRLLGSPASERSLSKYFKEASYGKANLSFDEEPSWLDIGMTHSEFCSDSENIHTDPSGNK